jgi:glycerol-3-phosphate dehydrogenase
LLYDALALWRNVARHRRLTAPQVLAREPGLEPRGLTSGAAYFDAATDDSRLTLANALAAESAGATVLNHTELRSFARDADGHATGARVRDALTGDEYPVRAAVIVNATGPWGDAVRHLADGAGRQATVQGSKGVHLAVPASRIGNRGAVTLLSAIDGRVMFVLPAGAHTIVGTTDTETTTGPDEIRASSSDVGYLLESVNAAFPAAALAPSDVVSAWAGIRPLIASGRTGDAGSASREHEIVRGPSGVFTVSGGKLTTYRAMAAEVVDAIETALNRAPSPARTGAEALPGAERLSAIAALAAAEPALAEPLVPPLPYRAADLVYAVRCEHALTLSDLLMRRTHVAFEMRDGGIAAAPRAAAIVARALGWDAGASRAAVDAYAADAQRVFAIGGRGDG